MNDKKIIAEIIKHIKKSYKNLDRTRYRQEPAYINALMGKLDGEVFDDGNGKKVQFIVTIVDDRGPNAAESKYGADFAIVFEKVGGKKQISKAILGQGKNGASDDLNRSEKSRLIGQCEKMNTHTSEYIVLEAPTDNSKPPMVRVGDPKNPLKIGARYTLEDYFLKKFIACKHGDKRDKFVEAVQDSTLNQLKIITRGLDLDLELNRSPGRSPGL